MSVECQTAGNGILLTAEYDVTLEPGQGFEADATLIDVETTISISENWICGAWTTTTFDGDLDVGCERNAGQAERETVKQMQFQSLETGTLPDPARIAIGGLVRSVALRGEPVAFEQGPIFDCPVLP